MEEDELIQVPTFEDLAIDDSLSDLERVTKYISSSIALQRVIHVKMLSETALSIGFHSTCTHLLPLLDNLVKDWEYVVRQHVAFQFPALCKFLVTYGKEENKGYRLLLDQMIPLIATLVADRQHEVRTAASDSLVEIAALVQPEDQGQHILTIILPLAHDDDDEQSRMSAVNLYQGLACHLGADLCQQFCVPELISLSADPVFRVRKCTAACFPNVCSTAGAQMTRERLLPAFEKLTVDEIWGVRKACAECFVSLSYAVEPKDRGPLLSPLFEALVTDSSRWVRMAAYQNLGPYIASLDPQSVTESLFTHFINMGSMTSAQVGGSGEVDIKYHCAFNLPAVVSLINYKEPIQSSDTRKVSDMTDKEQDTSKSSATTTCDKNERFVMEWKPKLSTLFENLSRDEFWKIRRTLAHSLHELAKILGPEISENTLSKVFDRYLVDNTPDVKFGVMLHFADFITQLSPAFRVKYLNIIKIAIKESTSDINSIKWRDREVWSEQLPQLCRLFNGEDTFSVIYPFVSKLVQDDVAVVRAKSFYACPLLMQRFSETDNPNSKLWLADLIKKLKALANSSRFVDRQVFVRLCECFISENGDWHGSVKVAPHPPLSQEELEINRKFFSTHFDNAFFELTRDEVSNVRLVVADTIINHSTFIAGCNGCPTNLQEYLLTDRRNKTDLYQLLIPNKSESNESIKSSTAVEDGRKSSSNTQDITNFDTQKSDRVVNGASKSINSSEDQVVEDQNADAKSRNNTSTSFSESDTSVVSPQEMEVK